MIILASNSPRRHELLKKLCNNFIIEACDVEEIQIADSPIELAIKNAELKAKIIAAKHENDIVIGADTIVALDKKIFGKPADKNGACEMLRELANKKHEVITGLAIVADKKIFSTAEITEVYFGEMSDEEISEYVATGEPLDKSGSYALQGGATKFIKKIHGDWTNVVGLPIYKLRQLAKTARIAELI